MPNDEKTSKRVASEASKLLKSKKTPQNVKAVAGSALSQSVNKPTRRAKRRKKA
jgi:hypothetical protein